MRRRGWLAALLGVVVLGLVGALAWWLGDASTAPRSAGEPSEPSEKTGSSAGSPRSAANEGARVDAEADASMSAAAHRMRELETSAALMRDEAEQARRAALRNQIIAAQRAREAEAAAKLANSPKPSPESAPPSQGLTKHVEGYDQLIDELNKDFLPLSDECITDALARAPELRGMLAIDFQLVVDEDLGAVIETVDIGPNNEVRDPELQECVRESLLSMILSPGAADGSTALSITLKVEPEPEPE